MRGRLQSIVLLLLLAIFVNSQCVARCLTVKAQPVSHDMPCHEHSKAPDCDHGHSRWSDAEVARQIGDAAPVLLDQVAFASTIGFHLLPCSITVGSRLNEAPPGSSGVSLFLSLSILRI